MKIIRLFIQSIFSWSIYDVLPDDEHIIFDAYFCLAFGDRTSEASESNEYLVNCLVKKYNQAKKPIISQSECAHAFPLSIYIDKIISPQEIEDDYLDTYSVVQECYSYCKKNDIKSVLVFAHPQHAWRVKKTLQKVGLNSFIANTEGTPYDRRSTQKWTRSVFIFIPREICTRLHYLFSGKI